MDNDEQRFATKQGLFGWKGLGKDPSGQTTIVTISMIVNFFLLAYAVSARGETNARGSFQPVGGPLSTEFYFWAGVTLLSCSISAYAIRYREFSARWWARFLACGLPALMVACLIYAGQS